MTHNGLYISHDEVNNMLMRDFKWANGFWAEEDVLYSIKEIMRLVGAKNVFKDTHAFIKLEDGRGVFPKDVVLVDTVAYVENVDTIEEVLECQDDLHFIPMRWMTDRIKRIFHSNTQDYYVKSNITYTLNNNYIFSNKETGIICVFYQKLPSDQQGNLLLPDNVSYLKAIAYDVAAKVAEQMFMWDKLSGDKLRLIQDKRAWYVSQAGNSTKIISPDERASIKNANLNWPNSVNFESNFHLNMYKSQKII